MNRIFLRVGVYSLICLGVSLLLSQGGSSQDIQDDISSRLIGSWVGEGKVWPAFASRNEVGTHP
jgi:hypothetical protein